MCKCINVQVCKCASVQMCKCEECKCTNVQMCIYANVHVCKYASMQDCLPMQSLNVCRFFSVSTRLMAIGLVLIQVFLFMNVQKQLNLLKCHGCRPVFTSLIFILCQTSWNFLRIHHHRGTIYTQVHPPFRPSVHHKGVVSEKQQSIRNKTTVGRQFFDASPHLFEGMCSSVPSVRPFVTIKENHKYCCFEPGKSLW